MQIKLKETTFRFDLLNHENLFQLLIALLLILGAIFILQGEAKSEASKYSSYRRNPNLRQQQQDLSDPQPSLLISLEKYTSPISFFYSSDNVTMESHIKSVLGSSSEKYTQDPAVFKGSLALVGKSDIKKYKRRMIIAVTSNSTSSITAMFNPYAYHAAPLALSVATNIALRAMNPSANNKIQVMNHPWGSPKRESDRDRSLDSKRSHLQFRSKICDQYGNPYSDNIIIGSAIMILLAFMLFTSSFIVGPIEDNKCEATPTHDRSPTSKLLACPLCLGLHAIFSCGTFNTYLGPDS